jgi:hypothetical protein
MDGTLSLAPLFVKMTRLIREMAAHAQFEQPFTDTSGCFKGRSRYAKKIHPDNVVESMSILALIHDHDYTSTADWLREHFDRQNCPVSNWDWLGAVYEDVFIKSIGRWATIVVTATSRKSVSDSMLREVKIRGTAEDLLNRYSKEEECLRFVTPETLCSPNVPFQDIDIHYEVGVHLSPLIFHVLKLRSLFQSKVPEDLPLTLVIELVFAFFFTNNAYRFHLEMVDLYKAIERNGISILKKGFIFPYLTNLIRRYGSLDGIESVRGIREGTLRFQACNGSMIADATIHRDMQGMFKLLQELQGVRASFPIFKRVVRDIEKSMQGNGILCSQKVLYSLAMIGVLD